MRMLRMNSIIPPVLATCLSGTATWNTSFRYQHQSTARSAAKTATASGYTLSVLVKAPGSTFKPDSIVRFGNTVFIGYQMAGDVKDGSVPGLTNTIVQYDLNAKELTRYTVPGHNDGLMARSDTNELWAMSNEDGSPELTIIGLVSHK
jgi:hypothetical protein